LNFYKEFVDSKKELGIVNIVGGMVLLTTTTNDGNNNNTTMKNIKRALTLVQRQAMLTAALAAVTQEINTINPKLEAELAELGFTRNHDCTHAGSRRVLKSNTVHEAILEVLPVGKRHAIKVSEICQRIKDGGLTYAETTVCQTLSNMAWDYSNAHGAYGQNGKIRKAHTIGQGTPAIYWRLK
jgi:hypothetical protein